MKVLRAIIGGFIAATLINSSWGVFTEELGNIGGILAAAILVGTMWFLNHYIGLIPNKKNYAFVDMGIAIGIGCIVRDVIKVKDIQEVVASMPTLIFVILGGCVGGTLYVIVKKDMKCSEENVEINDINNGSNLDRKLSGNKNGVGYGN